MKCKKQEIPEELVEKMQDQTVHLLDRVLMAEECRKEYDHPICEIAAMLGTNDVMYNNMLTIARSHNLGLIDKVKDGTCSVKKALGLLDANVEPGSSLCNNLFRYAWIRRIERLADVEIIYENEDNILYRTNEGLFLGVICNGSERIGVIDDLPKIVDTITDFLQNGCIRWKFGDFVLHEKGEKQYTYLKHFIVSVLTNQPCDVVKQATVSYKSGISQGIYDLRVSNLTCTLLTRADHREARGGFFVRKNYNHEIVIFDENHGHVFFTDYHEWLYQFMNERRDKFRYQSKDNRLCIVVGDKVEYLYHIVMAIHLYGEPTNEEELAEKLNQLRKDYFESDMVVDHLDTDIHNNRLSNLFLMSRSQNARKKNAQARITASGLPCFCWAERYDDTSIRALAGYVHPLRLPYYVIDGVFDLDRYLNELERAEACLHTYEAICKEFEKLERELEEKGEQNECN